MTREEAINHIKDVICESNSTKPNIVTFEQEKEALKMAIEALEQEPIIDKLRAEIKGKIEQEEFARSVFRHEEKDAVKAEQCTGSIMAYNNMIKFIDKYKGESEDKE